MENKIKIIVNKSKIYFTPLFNTILPISYFSKLKNTYFWYDDYKEDTFCLLYEFTGKVKGSFQNRTGFTVYEHDILMNSEHYMGHIDYGRHVLYKFELTDELFHYRNILLEGKYSKLPEKAKKLILDFNLKVYGPNDKEHIQKVLYRDKSLREDIATKYNVNVKYVIEASSIIKPENELFANSVIFKKENQT